MSTWASDGKVSFRALSFRQTLLPRRHLGRLRGLALVHSYKGINDFYCPWPPSPHYQEINDFHCPGLPHPHYIRKSMILIVASSPHPPLCKTIDDFTKEINDFHCPGLSHPHHIRKSTILTRKSMILIVPGSPAPII